MTRLMEGRIGQTYTVHKVKGGKLAAESLEQRGLAAGSDVTILERAPDGGILARIMGRELTLTPQEGADIVVDEQLVRKETDPVFLGGCCAYGCTADVWDKYVNGPPASKE